MEAKFPPYTARGGAPIGAAEAAEYYREIAGDTAPLMPPNATHFCGRSIAEPHDPVTKPAHYQRGGIETIDYIRATLGDEGFIAYAIGNSIKYLSRFRDKDGVQDLKKARVYLDWAIESMEKIT